MFNYGKIGKAMIDPYLDLFSQRYVKQAVIAAPGGVEPPPPGPPPGMDPAMMGAPPPGMDPAMMGGMPPGGPPPGPPPGMDPAMMGLPATPPPGMVAQANYEEQEKMSHFIKSIADLLR